MNARPILVGRVKPSLHQDEHLLFLWSDNSSVNIYELILKQEQQSHGFVDCGVINTSAVTLWENLNLKFRAVFFYLSKRALRHCGSHCLEKEDGAPHACTITSGAGALSHSVHLHLQLMEQVQFCLVKIVKSLLSLFPALERPFPEHK